MLSKRSTRPVIGKLSSLLVSGNRVGFSDVGTGPRCQIQSPTTPSARGLKCYDHVGVGLGIVAALDKSRDCGHEILAKFSACSSSILSKSSPIAVRCIEEEDLEIECLENYTYVTTCRGQGPNKSFFTRVYYGDEECKRSGNYKDKSPVSAARFVVGDMPGSGSGSGSVYPSSDFLSSCHLCRKKLHGKDIYMYRGEKAFCSAECRSTQIMMDERKEQCRSAQVSSSPYTHTRDHIFSTGILAI